VTYPWVYGKDMRFRGKLLFDLLRPYLQPGDCVLDVGCGYSPLADHIVNFGCQIRGFDTSLTPLKALRKRVSKGCWQQATYKTAKVGSFSILLLTGLTGHIGNASFIAFLKKAFKEKPRVILVDTVTGSTKRHNYDKLTQSLTQLILSYKYTVAVYKSRNGSRCRIFVRKED